MSSVNKRCANLESAGNKGKENKMLHHKRQRIYSEDVQLNLNVCEKRVRILSESSSRNALKDVSGNVRLVTTVDITLSYSKKTKLSNKDVSREPAVIPQIKVEKLSNSDKSTGAIPKKKNILANVTLTRGDGITSAADNRWKRGFPAFAGDKQDKSCQVDTLPTLPHFKSDIPKKLVTKYIPIINPNPNTGEDVLITEGSSQGQRRQKTQLLKKRQQSNLLPHSVHERCTLDVYFTEYLDTIMSYLMSTDHWYLLRKNFLHLNSHNALDRGQVLEWILKKQGDLHLVPRTFFIVVRLFDHILAATRIPRNAYQLVAIVLSWIVNKTYSVRIVHINKLLSLCGGAYCKADVLVMEMKILKAIGFKLCINVPTDFLHYYLFLMGICETDEIAVCSHFVLQAFALNHFFSTAAPSKLAAAALALTLETLHDNRIVKYYKRSELIDLMQEMTTTVVNLYLYQAFEKNFTHYTIEIRSALNSFIHNLLIVKM